MGVGPACWESRLARGGLNGNQKDLLNLAQAPVGMDQSQAVPGLWMRRLEKHGVSGHGFGRTVSVRNTECNTDC